MIHAKEIVRNKKKQKKLNDSELIITRFWYV